MKLYAAAAILGLLQNNAEATNGPDANGGSLVECALVNLQQSGPRELHALPIGVTKFTNVVEYSGAVVEYHPEDAGNDGWSIQCNTEGTVDYVKYFLSNPDDVKTHYSAPFWINGDNSGTYINKFDYLSESLECGEEKTIDVEFYTWKGGDEYPTDATQLVLQKADCPELPPKPANCYLAPEREFIFFGYNAKISPGTMVEAETSSGQRLFYPTDSSSPRVSAPDYQNYGKDPFKIRFVSINGVAGDWNGCTNYAGQQTVTDKCYLWTDKLFFGKSLNVPPGYKVEARTVVGKYFSYTATGEHYVQADDFRDYDSQPFHLRFVDLNGVPGPWNTCVNYTPIALDLDRSGAVEHITGDFVIDITADGDLETLGEWFAPTEGILVDTMLGTKHNIANSGGIITGHHLFGDMGRTYVDGYEKLSLLDANDDGLVSGTELDGLAIWTDSNSNAMLDDGELSSLESHDIVGLGVVHDNFISEAILADGSIIMMEDKWFVR